MEPSKEFLEILNTIPVEALVMMNEEIVEVRGVAGVAFEINDGKIIGIV